MPNYPTFPTAPHGTILAVAYHPSTLAELGQSTAVLAGKSTQNKNGAGNGGITIPLQLPNAERDLFQTGNLIAAFVYDSNYDTWLELTCFKIKNKKTRISNKNQLLDLAGPNLLQELAEIKIRNKVLSRQYGGQTFTAAGPSGGKSSAFTDSYDLTPNAYVGYSVRSFSSNPADPINWKYRGVVKSNTDAVIYLDGEFTNGEPTWPVRFVFYGIEPEATELQIFYIFNSFISGSGWYYLPSLPNQEPAIGSGYALVVANGESALETLVNLTEQSGDFFRLDNLTADRKLNWMYGAEPSGATLVIPDYSGHLESQPSYGKIVNVTEEEDFNIVTRVFPHGSGLGDDRLTIKDTTQTLPTGFDWVLDENGHKSGIRNVLLEADTGLTVEKSIDWPHIKPANKREESVPVAVEALVNAGVQFLRERTTSEKFYTITCTIGVELRPGQKIDIDATANGQNPYDIVYTGPDALYIQSVSHAVGKDGVRYTTLRLTETVYGRRDDSIDYITGSIKQQRATTRHTNTDPTLGVSGGSSTPTTGDHGTLAGLTDDDHPQYLLANGSRILYGDLVTLPGILIDGVDVSTIPAQISAHAADPDAHHVPGTLSVNSINANNGTETHEIITSSNPGAQRVILSTDEQGNITLRKISVEQFVLTDRITNRTYNVFIANGRMKIEPI